jgi:hypothetical protein
MPAALRDVRSQGQSGKHLLALSFSGFDPGCVKTCTSQECAELFSLSSSLSGGRKHFWFSNLRNRDGISTRRLNVGVFARPRPKGDIAQQSAYAAGSSHFDQTFSGKEERLKVLSACWAASAYGYGTAVTVVMDRPSFQCWRHFVSVGFEPSSRTYLRTSNHLGSPVIDKGGQP